MNKFSILLAIAICLISTCTLSSEDTDTNPTCPYILDEGESCESKSLKIMELDSKISARERGDIRDYVKVSYTIPEPSQIMLCGVGIAMFLMYRSLDNKDD